jgi:hypothetical protein
MTVEIPRFTDRLLAGELQESPLGAWVRYADHAAALAHTCAERGDAMPVRALTPEEEARLLTSAQVAALPDGTAVMIKWSGGNGPHRYYLRHWQGRFFGAVTMAEDPLSLDGELRAIGGERCHDRVFLPIDEVTP